jgi:ABC-2 type transport system permease protein
MNSALRICAILLRQFYLLRVSLARLFPVFGWIFVDIVLWGFMSRYLNRVAAPGYNFIPALLGAVLLWDFLTRVMQGVTMAFFEDVWSRNFLNLFASPLSVGEYLAGLVASAIATSAAGLVVMLVVATTAFGLSFLSYGVALFPFLLVLFLFGIALGIVGSSIVLTLGPAGEWYVWPIPFVIAPFAGVYYPLATLPASMRAVSRVLPPTYVFENVRAIAAGRPADLGSLAMAVFLAALYVLAACWIFTVVHRRAIRTGLIARYSAESVS